MLPHRFRHSFLFFINYLLYFYLYLVSQLSLPSFFDPFSLSFFFACFPWDIQLVAVALTYRPCKVKLKSTFRTKIMFATSGSYIADYGYLLLSLLQSLNTVCYELSTSSYSLKKHLLYPLCTIIDRRKNTFLYLLLSHINSVTLILCYWTLLKASKRFRGSHGTQQQVLSTEGKKWRLTPSSLNMTVPHSCPLLHVL